MFDIKSDPGAQLLSITWSGRVGCREMALCSNEIRHVLSDMRPGFRLLADYSAMVNMDPACGHRLGEIMDLCDAKGVGCITRVIPDPHKDIGLNILSFFHYRQNVAIITCESLEEAMQKIG